MLHYGGSTGGATMFLAVYAGLVSALISGYTPTEILWNMQAINVPIILIAKVSCVLYWYTPLKKLGIYGMIWIFF